MPVDLPACLPACLPALSVRVASLALPACCILLHTVLYLSTSSQDKCTKQAFPACQAGRRAGERVGETLQTDGDGRGRRETEDGREMNSALTRCTCACNLPVCGSWAGARGRARWNCSQSSRCGRASPEPTQWPSRTPSSLWLQAAKSLCLRM
jgi:hypothetical protein